eukprot:4017500-Pleurochrysis_carterae.AAC.1
MASVGGGCEQVPPLHSGGGGALQVAGLQRVRRDRGVRGRRDAAGLYYYVRTSDTELFHCDGWYSQPMI